MSHVMLIRVGVELPSRLMLTGTEGLTVATFNSTLSIKRESYDQHYTQHKLHYMMIDCSPGKNCWDVWLAMIDRILTSPALAEIL